MTGEDMESNNSPEVIAAKGMEVRKKVEGRVGAWKERMLQKNAVAKEYMNAWNKIKASATEGSFRQHAMEKITPIVENIAVGKGLGTESSKWTLKATGLVCKVLGVVGMIGGPEIVIPVGAIGTAAGLTEKFPEWKNKQEAKSLGKIGEKLGKSGLAHTVDSIMDKIVGWKGPKGPEMKPAIPRMA